MFEFVDRPVDRKIVKSKWVFDKKVNEQGIITRYKARLCAKGFTQTKGVDYDLTCAPTIDRSTINLLLCYCLEKNLIVKQFDVQTALLQADLKEEILMEVPEGFKDKYPKNRVIRLLRAIYGLKQSSRAFNEKLTQTMILLGWRQLMSDQCVFQKNGDVLAAFVDDCFVGIKDDISYTVLLEQLSKHLKIVDLGAIKHFLKISVEYDVGRKWCKLSQPVFIEEIISNTGMESAFGKFTVLDPHTKLEKLDDSPVIEKPYQAVVGQLIYLAVCTRPDIYFAVVKLSQFNNCYRQVHWNQLMHLVRYVKATKNEGLIIRPGDFRIRTFTDSDWGGNLDDRRSTSGVVVMLGESPILWKSKVQKSVAHSTMEAEFQALAKGVSFTIWISEMLKELGYDHPFTDLFCDNQGCIAALKGDNYKGRSKHNQIHFHIVQEKVKEKKMVINYVHSQDNIADLLTKVLTRAKLQPLKEKLGVGV